MHCKSFFSILSSFCGSITHNALNTLESQAICVSEQHSCTEHFGRMPSKFVELGTLALNISLESKASWGGQVPLLNRVGSAALHYPCGLGVKMLSLLSTRQKAQCMDCLQLWKAWFWSRTRSNLPTDSSCENLFLMCVCVCVCVCVRERFQIRISGWIEA